ncbi:triphosphoribosyl-dephospho-CoA synthase [Methyloligella sp. 2.7D]|uniref:triphosphoribosyl-dephospho-CoA synthase n=1 Tax=unclassified Methyloligella TaxID=2625955 RepID=UPI00157C2F59|nr:triphosphoribosyl-dephospho-CoA synthase [Methyloligella sp. GL2]QKP77779.1 triphosphoribosyl-dephospho-CoA synthase [Methyloligella sp. GL2]
MSAPLPDDVVAEAFRQACLAELDALKPGNVHRHAGGHSLDVVDFEKSADVAAPSIGADLSVGARIKGAAEATAKATGTNTNLGILLLCAPLAAAAQKDSKHSLQTRLAKVLMKLSREDAIAAYAGIRAANAGGLGEVAEHDVADEPGITLLEAMAEAQGRDRIAWNYTHDFADIFELGLTRLDEGMRRWDDLSWAISSLFLGFLAAHPDSLIARKFGIDVAAALRKEAVPFDEMLAETNTPDEVRPQLLAFDRSLKARGFNPGTSADLTVATLFAASLQRLETPK